MEDSEDQEPVSYRNFKKGNRFWEARSSHGRSPKFDDPDLLWDACCQYFQWVDENPLWEDKAAQYQGAVVDMPVAKMRAMTLTGLCLFIDISDDTWRTYREKPDLLGVCDRAERIIRDQKFTGASAGLLNPMIIARDLGLREASVVEHSGSMDINKMTDDELNNKLMALINESSGS